MTEGRSVSAKSDNMTWRSEWMPCLEKFSENSLKASSSRNRIVEGEGSEDEKAPEWRGFRAGVDLHLGARNTTNVNEQRGRERKTIRKVPSNFKYIKNIENKYVCMGNAWTCDMQKNSIMGSTQSKPISTQTYNTHLNAWKYHYNANVMQCMRF